jgi:hypothetical protein
VQVRQPELLEPLEGFPPKFDVTASDVKVVTRVADFFLDYAKYLSPTGPMSKEHVKMNASRMPAHEFWNFHMSHLRAAAPIAKVVLAQVQPPSSLSVLPTH